MGALQPGHLILILVIVLIIFGPGKMSSLGADIGKGIREFRKATDAADGPTPAVAAATRRCASCSASNAADAKFCTSCGAMVGPQSADATARGQR
jgi:sec-independent protein translocase protein TatA